MRFGTYMYQREHIRVKRMGHMSGSGFGVWGLGSGIRNRTREMKMRNMKQNKVWKHETRISGMDEQTE